MTSANAGITQILLLLELLVEFLRPPVWRQRWALR
jgi:hypothetical protein